MKIWLKYKLRFLQSDTTINNKCNICSLFDTDIAYYVQIVISMKLNNISQPLGHQSFKCTGDKI